MKPVAVTGMSRDLLTVSPGLHVGRQQGVSPLLAWADTISPSLTALIWKLRTTTHPPLGLIRRNIKLGAAVLRECLDQCTAMCFGVAFSYLSVTRLKEVLGSGAANLGYRGWLCALTPPLLILQGYTRNFIAAIVTTESWGNERR